MEATPTRPTRPSRQPVRSRGRDPCTGWCRARASFPQFLVDRVLSGQGLLEGTIVTPRAGHVRKIALPAPLSRHIGASRQCFERDLIEALVLLPRSPAQGGVHDLRYLPK